MTLATVHPIREAMRNWPTGVAVLTTADPDGWWRGCTVNSVAPVSAHPPIVSVSIPRDALPPTNAFAIHLLRTDQAPLADHFARTPSNFDNVEVECGFGPVPLLREAATRLECHPISTLPAGANTLLLAKVHRAQARVSNRTDPRVQRGGLAS
jgi:flavin reductase (DIM6/NTAB) family NADH-FMN oxidoreductase RutF